MGAHTITTEARIGARGCTKRTLVPGVILALSLAVALFAATASGASATTTLSTASATPPPMTLSVGFKPTQLSGLENKPQLLEKKLKFFAATNNDSTLVVGGAVKKTTKQLAAGEVTKIKARLKHLKRVKRQHPRNCYRAKLKLAATDVFGQTVTDEFKVGLSITSAGGISCPH